MIDCSRFDALQRDALEGPLSPERQAEVDAHLAACPACLTRLRNLVVQSETLRRLGADAADDAASPLPEPLVQRILSALAAQRGGGVPKARDGTQG